MIFNSISLENFGCIKSFSKEFSKGVLVLAGQNGMGKSTILKAILLAVFDDYQGTLQDYVNWQASFFQVIVNFSHHGIDYESIVKYDGSTDRTLKFQDKVLKGDEAKKKLKDVIDVDLLKAGMLAMEQKIAIVETKPAERREYLKRIYDIEFKRQLQDLSDDIKATEIEVAKKTATRTEIEGRNYSLPEKPVLPFEKANYDLLKANLEIERKNLHIANEANEKRDRLNADYLGLQAKINQAKDEIEKGQEKVNDLKEKLSELPINKANAKESKKALIDECKEKEKASDADYASQTEKLNSELQTLTMARLPAFDIDEYNETSKSLYVKKERLRELQNAKDVCPTCGQSISSPEHIAKRKIEVQELEKETASLSMLFLQLEDKKRLREHAENENREKEKKQADINHELALIQEKSESQKTQMKMKIEQLENELLHIDDDFSRQEDSIKQILEISEVTLENYKKQIADWNTRIVEVQVEIGKLRNISTFEIEYKIKNLEADIKLYDDTVVRIAEFQKLKDSIEKQKAEDEKQLEIVRSEIQKLTERQVNYEMEMKLLKSEFPVYVISRVIKDIEKTMNEFLKQTYPKYHIEVQDKKNALHIVYGPNKKDVSCASGFERQIFSLSFMFAISRAIGNRCLILDEADSAASDKNSEIFYRVLGDSIGSGIDQIILVSHKQSTRDVLQFDYGADVITFENGVAA